MVQTMTLPYHLIRNYVDLQNLYWHIALNMAACGKIMDSSEEQTAVKKPFL